MATKKAPEIKRIGGKRKPPDVATFELVAWRDDQEVVLTFQARPSGETTELLQVLANMGDNGDTTAMANTLLRMLRKQMNDGDGTPDKWAAKRHVPDTADVPEGEEPRDAEPEPDEASYIGPDGALHPFSDTDTLDKFEALENGSSRRRWRHLMEDDDELTVYLQDLMGVGEYLIELGGKGRTSTRR